MKAHAVRVDAELVARAQALAERALGQPTGEERAALGGLVGVLVGGLLGSVSFFLF